MANFKDVLTILIGITSLVGFVATWQLYWKSKVIKAYAAEREFNHIEANLKASGELLGLLDKQIDSLELDIRETKACVLTFSQRLDSILVRLELQSGVFGHRKRDDET